MILHREGLLIDDTFGKCICGVSFSLQNQAINEDDE